MGPPGSALVTPEGARGKRHNGNCAVCADGWRAAVAAVGWLKAKFTVKGSPGKERKRQAGRGTRTLAGHLLRLASERHVHVGAGSIAIKRCTPIDSRMVPEESEGVRGSREAEGRGGSEAGRGDVSEDNGSFGKSLLKKK